MSHLEGHGDVTLPADYVAEHVRLGYAATAHGHEGDTLYSSLSIVTDSTSLPSLYVEATRGRHDNHLFVVTEQPDLAEARDVLEQVLHNDRADVPAVVQRQHLAEQVPRVVLDRRQPSRNGVHDRPGAVDTRRALTGLERRAALAGQALRVADHQFRTAAARYQRARAELARAAPWARRRLRQTAQAAAQTLDQARQQRATAEASARTVLAALHVARRQSRLTEHGSPFDQLDRMHGAQKRYGVPKRDRPGLGR